MKMGPPKPNTLAVSWFYGEREKETLILQPKYQRNPIWSIGQKCFLIDSLISGCPIPQVYINIKTTGGARDKRTFYEVVDGQQRLRAILEFLRDEWQLIATAAKAYPVSEEYKPHVNKKYSELPERLQNAIWDYPIAVQEIRGWDDIEIRAMFRRLNYVNERLNDQELRHSQYFGEFNEAVEKLTQDAFWDDIHLFTRRDSERMKDVEFVSELFVVVMDGVQDQQKTLDKFYADYDVVFPNKNRFLSKFRQTISSLRTIKDAITGSRFTKRADFYALFAAAAAINDKESNPVNLQRAAIGLGQLAHDLEGSPESLTGTAQRYYTTVIEGPNKAAKRVTRRDILLEILR
ncbi:MAG: DUF262 domain-containing protein [Acidobacteriota bacterium]